MKKIILLFLLAAGSIKNVCKAGDTLYVFFNSADSNQTITKKIKRIYIPPLFKTDGCVIEKSCWFRYGQQGQDSTFASQFRFTYDIVTDSVNQDESNAVEDAWALTKRYEQINRQNRCKTPNAFAKRLVLAIKVFKTYNKYGHAFIKKDHFIYNDPSVIHLSDIKTKEQLEELKNRLTTKIILLIDMQQQHKRNKWLAYKVTAVNLPPIERKDIKT